MKSLYENNKHHYPDISGVLERLFEGVFREKMNNIFQYFNKRIKFFTWWDLKLAQLAAMIVMLILIKLIPAVTKINYIWLIIALILVSIRLFYVMFFKSQKK